MSDLPLGRLDDLAAFCIVSTEQLLISNGPRNLHTLHDQSCRDLSAMIPDVTGDTSQAASLKLKCSTPLRRSLHRPVLLLFPHNAENINTALSVHTPSQDIYDRAIMACDQVLQHFPSAPARDAPVPSS